MGKRKDNKKEIIKEIQAAALLYKEKLVGKKFLYVFEGRYIEVIYKTRNFRHLTGVDTQVPAKRFYKYAIEKKLQVGQIYFSDVHPYELCKRKIKHIKNVATLAGSESFMLEEIVTTTRTYKFGTTDLNFSICMNKEIDEEGKDKGDCYVVESLRDEDCFSKSKSAYAVTHIFSKANDSSKYTELLFMDKTASMDDLPEAVRRMIVNDVVS